MSRAEPHPWAVALLDAQPAVALIAPDLVVVPRPGASRHDSGPSAALVPGTGSSGLRLPLSGLGREAFRGVVDAGSTAAAQGAGGAAGVRLGEGFGFVGTF